MLDTAETARSDEALDQGDLYRNLESSRAVEPISFDEHVRERMGGPGALVCGNKTPKNSCHIDRLRVLFPGA